MTERVLDYSPSPSPERGGVCRLMLIALVLGLLSIVSLICSFLMVSRRMTDPFFRPDVADLRITRWSAFITVTCAVATLLASIAAMIFGRAKRASALCLFVAMGVWIIAYIELIA